MSVDLAAAYTRTALAPVNAANDARLTTAINVALAAIQNYLDRAFIFDAQVDAFYYTHQKSYALDRYPVESVSFIGADGSAWAGRHEVHHETGIIEFDNLVFRRGLKITYAGGYRVLPADLELAFWMVFDTIYMMGQAVGAGGGLAAGEIESITIPDVGTVRFASGDTSAASDSGTGGGTSLIPAYAINLLQPYKRVSA